MDGWMLGVKTRHAKVAIIQNYHTYSVLNETFIIVVVLSSTRRRATLCEVDVISFSVPCARRVELEEVLPKPQKSIHF
jgi:hypothetical protein